MTPGEGPVVVRRRTEGPAPKHTHHQGADDLIASLADSAWDICTCGDWRWNHADGKGRCLACHASGPTPYNRCRRFRFSRHGDPDDVARVKWVILLAPLDGQP